MLDRSRKIAEDLDPMRSATFRSALAEDDFVDRRKLRAALVQRLVNAEPDERHALLGPSGAGKTTIAAHVAIDPKIRQAFPGGVLWEQVGALSAPDTILLHWARALSIEADVATILPTSHRRRRLANELTKWPRGKILVVIDDIHQPADAAAHVFEQLPNLECVYLLTTQADSIAGEFVGDAFKDTRVDKLGGLDPEESLDLFRKQAGALVGRHLDALSGIATALDHQPYALSILARHLKVACADGSSAEAGALRAAAAASKHGLGGVIALAIGSVHGKAARSLEELSVFPAEPESFSAAAAKAVAGATADRLGTLLARGLIERRSDRPGGERYALHPRVRERVRPSLEDEPSRHAAVCLRMALHYAEFVLENRATRTAHAAADSALIAEMENIDRALSGLADVAALPAQLSRVLEGARTYSNFLRARGWNRRGERQLRRLHDALMRWKQPDPGVACCLARHFEKIAAYPEARELLHPNGRDGSKLHRRADNVTQARMLHVLAVLAYNKGEFGDAETFVDHGLRRCSRPWPAPPHLAPWLAAHPEDSELVRVVCDLHERRCVTALALRKLPQARESTAKGLRLARALGDAERRAEHLLGATWLALHQHRYAAACRLAKIGMEWAKGAAHLEYQAGFHHRLGELALRRGNALTAQGQFTLAHGSASRIAHFWYVAICLLGLGQIEYLRHRRSTDPFSLDGSRKDLLQAREQARRIDAGHLIRQAERWLNRIDREEKRRRAASGNPCRP